MEYRELIPLTETEVDQIIPHRRPFRFIDSVLEVEFGKRAVAMMSDLSKPEYYWINSHFPSDVYVPGFIIAEALAEVGGVAILGLPKNRNKIALLHEAHIHDKKDVRPGESIRLEIVVTRLVQRMGQNFGEGRGRAFSNEGLIMWGDITFSLKDKAIQ